MQNKSKGDTSVGLTNKPSEEYKVLQRTKTTSENFEDQINAKFALGDLTMDDLLLYSLL